MNRIENLEGLLKIRKEYTNGEYNYRLTAQIEEKIHGLQVVKSAAEIINRAIESLPMKPDSIEIKGDYVEDGGSKVKIEDSVVLRSQIGTVPKPINICSSCGQEFELLKTPKYCPYCGEKLS